MFNILTHKWFLETNRKDIDIPKKMKKKKEEEENEITQVTNIITITYLPAKHWILILQAGSTGIRLWNTGVHTTRSPKGVFCPQKKRVVGK